MLRTTEQPEFLLQLPQLDQPIHLMAFVQDILNFRTIESSPIYVLIF